MLWLKSLLHNIRFYILTSSILFSVLVYFYIIISIPLEQLQIIRLTQIYALTSLVYLYLALLAGPFCYTFRAFPFRGQYLKARRAIGVSAFYFSLLHACFAFFGQLGGFEGLGFLSRKYMLAIGLSFTALIILFLMAATSFDFMVAKLSFPRWKMLHRLVYIAGVFILIHAVMLGTNYQKLYEFIPQLTFTAVAFLLFLEILRIDAFFKKKFPNFAQSSIATIPLYALLFIGIIFFLLPFPETTGISFGIHAQHIQIAKEAQQGIIPGSSAPGNLKIPGLQGDRTKRYSVDFSVPENIQPNTDTTLSFKVYDASSGNQVFLFNKVYSKLVHLIIVDSALTYFNHIHPDFKDGVFTITTQFPKNSQYHLYADFQPFGAIEQRIATTLNAGSVEEPEASTIMPDTQLTKAFGNYEVTLQYPKPLKSDQISIGQQLLGFTIKDAMTKRPITTLKPYLEAFGHMVMINQKTYDYIHVHPNDLRVPLPDENGGPTVEFMPLGLYGPIKPGVYRIFAQFNPDNELFTTDFTVEIE